MCFLLTFLYKKRINDQPWIEDESNLYQDGDSTRVSLDCNFMIKSRYYYFAFIRLLTILTALSGGWWGKLSGEGTLNQVNFSQYGALFGCHTKGETMIREVQILSHHCRITRLQ